MVEVGTRVYRNGMYGEVVLHEQPFNLHRLKFLRHGDVDDVNLSMVSNILYNRRSGS